MIGQAVRDRFSARASRAPTPKEVCVRVALSHLPKLYAGPVTVFHTAGKGEDDGAWRDEPLMGWGGYLRDIEFQPVSGGHLSMLVEPHVQVLAQLLIRCLRKSAPFSGAEARR